MKHLIAVIATLGFIGSTMAADAVTVTAKAPAKAEAKKDVKKADAKKADKKADTKAAAPTAK